MHCGATVVTGDAVELCHCDAASPSLGATVCLLWCTLVTVRLTVVHYGTTVVSATAVVTLKRLWPVVHWGSLWTLWYHYG